MGFIKRNSTVFMFSVLFFAGAVWAYINFVEEIPADFSIISPLPALSFYTSPEKQSYWKPKDELIQSSYPVPQMSAKAVFAYDLTSEKIIYKKNHDTRYPMASLTKIMTAIVAIENESLDKEYVISERAATIGENSMGTTKGERFSLDELLYGLFLHSGNDAAEAIAEGSKFGREDFVFQMNKKAEDLGLSDTHFTNPSGLEGDGNQHSSAYDLLVITRYGLTMEPFARVSSTFEKFIPASEKHGTYHLFNETNLLTTYPGVKGVKTGFTNEAGMCLITYLEYGGHKIIAVLLNSQNRRQEMKDLLDYSLQSLGVTPPEHS